MINCNISIVFNDDTTQDHRNAFMDLLDEFVDFNGFKIIQKPKPAKKCYIAGQITGLPEEIYKANFEKAKAEVLALGFEPVSPVDLPHNHNKTWTDYLREDLTALMKCDCIYAINGWSQSNGARLELNTAAELGFDIYYQKEEESKKVLLSL